MIHQFQITEKSIEMAEECLISLSAKFLKLDLQLLSYKTFKKSS